ncbi:MAG TPA: hypothetical protein VGP00_05155 [Nocardioides sp.]|nr:hypothetical protein [Nocardioides sp.]
MAREIPEVVRAAAGLAATVLDEARKLPETLPGLPVRILGIAMQQAMKVQQQYAGLVARGDELFTGIRGNDEPGMATFDDDEPAASTGYRDSAFDRAGDMMGTQITDDEVSDLPADPAADAVVAVVDQLADQVEAGQQSIEELVEASPETAEILDEIAIDELVDEAPTPAETAPDSPALILVGSDEGADSPVAAEPATDVSTSVDVLTPDGEIATVDATVTDEGIAAVEEPSDAADADAEDVATTDGATDTAATDTAATDTAASDTNAGTARATDEGGTPVAAATGVSTDVGDTDTSAEDAAMAQGAALAAVGADSATPTDDPEGGSELSGAQAAGAAPIEGYDGFSIAQLRGRLRGYALSTVQDLVAYEQSTRAREPYLRMLHNRLEKLDQQAIESSPLAPRGA